MSAATLVAPVATPRQAHPRRSLDHVYPLFGFRREVHYVPLLHRQAEIDGWLLRQDNREPNEPWTSRWRRCQRECRSAFKQIWVVRLPRQSRSLTPGDYVFDPLTDFLNLPGSPPPVVQDCYREAFAELPRHRFVYLDLLWNATPDGLRLLSPAQLRANVNELEHRFRRRLRHDRLLIQAARTRQREMMARLRADQGMLREIRLPSTPAEARRILGLSDDQLRRSLQVQVQVIEFTKFDPAVVFEEPALLERAGGHMPLGLVAHWD